MKKFMIVPIVFFNVAYGMEYKQRDIFEAFKEKCQDMKVDRGASVHSECLDAHPEEVCAAIQNISTLAKKLPREIYEKPLKELVIKQQKETPDEYRKLVDQLVHMVLVRPRSHAHDHISPLICKAVGIQTYCYETRGVELQRENTRLSKASNSTMSTVLALAAGFLIAKLSSNLLG